MTFSGSAHEDPILALQQLVLDDDLERLEDLIAEFNIFDVLKIEQRELQHSAFLAWLLDPNGSHSLQDYFLRRFLSAAAAKAYDDGIHTVTPIQVDSWNFSATEVATERDYIDVVIVDHTDEFVCFIENKITATEHSCQLQRYLDTIQQTYPGFDHLPIFLTPDGIEPNTQAMREAYVAIDYQLVADLIDRTLRAKQSSIGAGVREFLEHYAKTLRRHVMTNTDNIDELALQIYNKHQAAIDLIIKARPSLEAKGWAVLDQIIADHDDLLEPDFHANLYHRFYAPNLEQIPGIKNGDRWTKSKRIILFEVRYRERVLSLIIGPGPQETRERIYQITQDPGSLPAGIRNTQKLSQSWHTLYRKRLITTDGTSEPDYEKNRTQVEAALTDFFETDYWLLVNAIRAQFDLPAVNPST